ncbi:MAG: GNAT family N-acetyltransferase [Chlorobiaceae bacterium]|nr:GNAT family N-acetyltransferase [Chlorobiaceae bacterium]
MSLPRFSITPLSRKHQKSGFCSDSELLDRYFSERAGQDVKRNLAKCFVAIDCSNEKIAGFYTLSAAQIPLLQLPEKLAGKMPHYHAVQALRLGWLAIDKSCQGHGLGSTLIADALKRSSRSSITVYAMLVDAKDENALKFYLHHGFIPCKGAPQTLFLPLDTVRKL